jgi:hypothetical protein
MQTATHADLQMHCANLLVATVAEIEPQPSRPRHRFMVVSDRGELALFENKAAGGWT